MGGPGPTRVGGGGFTEAWWSVQVTDIRAPPAHGIISVRRRESEHPMDLHGHDTLTTSLTARIGRRDAAAPSTPGPCDPGAPIEPADARPELPPAA